MGCWLNLGRRACVNEVCLSTGIVIHEGSIATSGHPRVRNIRYGGVKAVCSRRALPFGNRARLCASIQLLRHKNHPSPDDQKERNRI